MVLTYIEVLLFYPEDTVQSKQLGSCVAMVLTYIEVLLFYPEDTVLDWNMITALALVVMGIVSFAVSTRDSNQMEQLRKASAHNAEDWSHHYVTAPTAAVQPLMRPIRNYGRCQERRGGVVWEGNV